jgi:hypothetical protein
LIFSTILPSQYRIHLGIGSVLTDRTVSHQP